MLNIEKNLNSVKQRIVSACKKSGRLSEDVRLVCVTKLASAGEIEEALRLGVANLGENRVQDASAKYAVIGGRAKWHLVGHLQTNKAKDAVKIFSLIHSIDSLRLAKEVDGQAAKIGKVQDILIQVNMSGEEAKFGIKPRETDILIKELSSYRNIDIKGLMTIAPEVDDPETVRPYFRALRELRDKINAIRNTQYTILSMGMTNDFEIAIEEGANMVRIGRAIFAGDA